MFCCFEQVGHSWMIFITDSILCYKSKGYIDLDQTSNLETYIFRGLIFIKNGKALG